MSTKIDVYPKNKHLMKLLESWKENEVASFIVILGQVKLGKC